jgi:hypothetical protein
MIDMESRRQALGLFMPQSIIVTTLNNFGIQSSERQQ